MPQAVRICIPPLGNEMVNLVLNSSLAMIIGYAEIKAGEINCCHYFPGFLDLGHGADLILPDYMDLALFLRYLEERTRIPGLGISGGA